MRSFILTLSLLSFAISMTAQPLLFSSLPSSYGATAAWHNITEDEKAYTIIENESSKNIESITYDLENEVFNTVAKTEIAYIQLSCNEEIIFKKLPVFSKTLHLILKNYSSGEYELKIMYADSQVPSIINIRT